MMSMVHRWIIRSCFIALLLLCMDGWKLSREQFGWVGYQQTENLWLGGLQDGSLYAFHFSLVGVHRGWHYQTGPFHLDVLDHHTNLSFIGFVFASHGTAALAVGIPFWFLTGAAALSLVYAWCKMGQSKKLQAFPVEIKMSL